MKEVGLEKCLYHFNHKLVSFCKCNSCYLPVCEVCVKIHKKEHAMHQTEPIFQNIDFVIQAVTNEYLLEQSLINELRNKLSELPKGLVQSQKQLKNSFVSHRQRLIDNFQKYLLQLQKSFLSGIESQQLNFLACLQHLQRQSEVLSYQIKEKQNSLDSPKSSSKMQTIIEFYSQDDQAKFKKHYERLFGAIKQCINFKLEEHQLQLMKQLGQYFESKLRHQIGAVSTQKLQRNS